MLPFTKTGTLQIEPAGMPGHIPDIHQLPSAQLLAEPSLTAQVVALQFQQSRGSNIAKAGILFCKPDHTVTLHWGLAALLSQVCVKSQRLAGTLDWSKVSCIDTLNAYLFGGSAKLVHASSNDLPS